jgi:hydrogenase expression/formation protein HypE
MRSVLQLRTPEVPGNNDQRSRLTGSCPNSAATSAQAPPVQDPSKIRFKDPQIEMSHGAGGKASRRIVEGLFAPLLLTNSSEQLADAAHIEINGATVAFTADSFVVRPLRFAGGSIGELAVNGTVNDLAVSGAKAHSMVVTFVLEEGLPSSVLEAEVRAMSDALKHAGVTMVGGDTKVVERGKADGMYITTAGIGTPIPGIHIDARTVRPGDKVLLSGPIGDHGITILLARADLDLEADLCSDTRSVLPMIESMAAQAAPGIRWMRDPTRGGLATSLNELARDCGLSVELNEEEIPLRDEVRGACELLGLDPLHIANEGQFIAIVSPEFADIALNAIQLAEGGDKARIIGQIRTEPANAVVVNTRYGGTRIVDMLVGDPLPRIC